MVAREGRAGLVPPPRALPPATSVRATEVVPSGRGYAVCNGGGGWRRRLSLQRLAPPACLGRGTCCWCRRRVGTNAVGGDSRWWRRRSVASRWGCDCSCWWRRPEMGATVGGSRRRWLWWQEVERSGTRIGLLDGCATHARWLLRRLLAPPPVFVAATAPRGRHGSTGSCSAVLVTVAAAASTAADAVINITVATAPADGIGAARAGAGAMTVAESVVAPYAAESVPVPDAAASAVAYWCLLAPLAADSAGWLAIGWTGGDSVVAGSHAGTLPWLPLPPAPLSPPLATWDEGRWARSSRCWLCHPR